MHATIVVGVDGSPPSERALAWAVDEAAAHGDDLLLIHARMLVVGSRGLGGFKGMLLGSISTSCVHHATCPIVIVPPE